MEIRFYHIDILPRSEGVEIPSQVMLHFGASVTEPSGLTAKHTTKERGLVFTNRAGHEIQYDVLPVLPLFRKPNFSITEEDEIRNVVNGAYNGHWGINSDQLIIHVTRVS